MIHEWRTYRLKAGAANAYLALLADEGLPLVTRHLPLTGYWLGETGPLNTIHHLWAYADWAEREAARAALQREEAWTTGFIPRAFAMVEQQENRFLRLTRSSPAYDRALADRRRAHPAREAGAPLFADRCSALLTGATEADCIAQFAITSGIASGPVTLAVCGDDFTRPLPAGSTSHIVLRSLSFSPL